MTSPKLFELKDLISIHSNSNEVEIVFHSEGNINVRKIKFCSDQGATDYVSNVNKEYQKALFESKIESKGLAFSSGNTAKNIITIGRSAVSIGNKITSDNDAKNESESESEDEENDDDITNIVTGDNPKAIISNKSTKGSITNMAINTSSASSEEILSILQLTEATVRKGRCRKCYMEIDRKSFSDIFCSMCLISKEEERKKNLPLDGDELALD